jgi:small GTP-binding protein
MANRKKMPNVDEIFDRLGVPPEKRKIITEKLNEKLSYKPKIGVFGKTGVGKSSLCNALFGQDLCKISDIKSCTRNPQEVIINMGGKGITLLDVPGVGENQERDEEYGKLYNSLLPTLDLALWVLKGDDRAFSSDEHFYKNIVKPHIDEGKPFFFVLNQVDKIEPFREWNEAERRPGVTQLSNIDKKVEAVSRAFDCPKGWVIPVSANEKYQLDVLVDTFIFALPREQKITVGRNVKKENISVKTKEVIEKSWIEEIAETVSDFVTEIKETVDGLKEQLGDALKDAGEWIWDNTFGRCYITTATCETLGKADDCYELNMFRDFRDNWLDRQSYGKELIKEYYSTAPLIVKSINRQAESVRIYQAIWDEYLSDCLHLIEDGDYTGCKEKYVTMVRNLKREYLQ